MTVTEPGVIIDPGINVIKVNGSVVKPLTALVYIMLNKPPGYITSVSARQGKTVIDLVKSDIRVFPVGRLDKNSRGLILLTNDGDLAYRLTHPRYGHPKKYIAGINGRVSASDIKATKKGIELEEGLARFSDIRLLKEDERGQTFEITLRQGFKRQIRRMFKVFGRNVVDLKRISIGSLELGDLPEGKSRNLTGREIANLKKETVD